MCKLLTLAPLESKSDITSLRPPSTAEFSAVLPSYNNDIISKL